MNKPNQAEIERARALMLQLGSEFYGPVLAAYLSRDQPMALIRIMCEDAIHDEWDKSEITRLRDVLLVFRAAQRP